MALPLYNETGFVGTLLVSMSNNITGSLFLTLLLITVFIVLITLLFRFPFEASAIIVMPLLLVFMATTGEFRAVGGLILIYMAVIFAKNFFLK